MKKIVWSVVALLGVGITVHARTSAESDSLKVINLQEVQVVSTRATAKTPMAFTNIGKAELKKVLTEKDEEIVKPSIPGGIINAIPKIEAKDRLINVGQKFEPLEGVTATDKEDGTITKIDVIENTVNENVAGTYKVTYKVTDSKGAEAIKTIIVTVKKDAVLAQSVTINNKINSLYVGSNKTFTATVNEEADKKDVEWSVSDENIASIEVNGNSVKVIAKAKGQVTITAKTTDGSNKVDTFTINVEEYKDNVVDFITDIIDVTLLLLINGKEL